MHSSLEVSFYRGVECLEKFCFLFSLERLCRSTQNLPEIRNVLLNFLLPISVFIDLLIFLVEELE